MNDEWRVCMCVCAYVSYVPVIRRCEIFRRSRGHDILGHSSGPEMQQTIQNKGDENTCNLHAQELKRKKQKKN